MNALRHYLCGGAMLCALLIGAGNAPQQSAFAQAQAQEQEQEQTNNQNAAPNETQDFKRLIDEIKAQHDPFYNARITTLSNGMQVVAIPNDRAPVVTHMVWYGVGGADEAVGESGTAHFLEHLLFKGTTAQEPGEFSRIVKNMGGRDNAFTSWDYTAYFQTIPADELETVMRLEADRMRGAAPSQEDFLSERDVVIEERRQTLDNNPAARMYEQLRHALFVNHPYGRPIVGWMHEIQAHDWSSIKAFYDRWYSPSNAVLIVAGDVDTESFFEKAESIYGQIEAFDVPQNNRPQRADFDTAKVITMEDPLVKQRSFTRLRVAQTSADAPLESLKIALIGMMLDGGATSRLYKSIVMEQKKAVNAYFSYSGFAQDYGTMSYGGTPTDDTSFEALEQALLAEFRKAAENGFTAEELERAKNRIIDGQIFELDSVTGPAMIFGRAMMVGIDPEYLEYWTHVLKAITLEDVNKVAAKILPRVSAGEMTKEERENSSWAQSLYGYLVPQGYEAPAANNPANDNDAAQAEEAEKGGEE